MTAYSARNIKKKLGIGESARAAKILGEGTFTANGTSAVTVTNSAVTADSVVIVSLKTVGGTVGAVPSVKTVTAGTGFTISGTASDTSVYNYKIIG